MELGFLGIVMSNGLSTQQREAREMSKENISEEVSTIADERDSIPNYKKK